MAFYQGSIVHLKDGGPYMFVKQFLSDQEVHCTWADEDGIEHSENFTVAELMLAETGQGSSFVNFDPLAPDWD